MAKEFIGAESKVLIEPNTRGFRAKLREQLRELQIDDFSVPVNFDPDSGRLRTEMERIRHEAIHKDVIFDANTSPVDKVFQKWNHDTLIKGRISVDDTDYKKFLNGAAKGRDLRIKANLDTTKVRAEAKVAVRQATEEFNKLNPVARNIRNLERDRVSLSRENLKLLGEQRKYYADTFNALSKADPSKHYKTLNMLQRKIAEIDKTLADPLKQINLKVDMDGYESTMLKLDKIMLKQRELDHKNIRMKVYTDMADGLDNALVNLRRRFADLPEGFTNELNRLSGEYRKFADRIGKNPEARLNMKVEADTARAREELKHLREKNDKIKIDAEIESAGATAHLLYLTRPRTVNIFARVKDTNLGKIMQGITYGATGLQGVTNQFNRLVNMFDKLDVYVPRLATISSIIGSIGVGSINLAGSIGAVGTSLAIMSKGLLAAPALLGAFGSAMWLLWGSQQKGAYKFDWSNTPLGGLRDKGLESFWNGVTPKLKEMANQIAPTINREFLGIATAYGKTAGAMLDMVSASDKMGMLPRLLENTKLGVEKLGQPVRTLTETFLMLGDQSSVLFPRMVDWLNKPANVMRDWVKQAESTGAVTVALREVAEQGSFLRQSFFDLVSATGRIFSLFATGQNGLESFSDAVRRFSNVVHSVKFTETITAWVEGAQHAKGLFHDSLTDMGNALYNTRTVTTGVFQDMGKIASGLISTVSNVIGSNGTGIRNMTKGIADGFSSMFKAVSDNKSVFGDFMTMIGSLSRTFGTTLAAGLRTVSPLMSVLAKTATAVAGAVSKIPEPVLGAIALWRTFGSSGVQAWNALKQGLAEYLVKMAEYRVAMASVSMSGNFQGGGMLNMLGAYGQQQLAMVKGAEAAEQAASKATTSFGKLKLAGSGLLASMGGLSGVLGTLGVGAAIAGITIAWSSYTEHTQKAKQVTDNVASSLNNLTVSAEAVAKGLTPVSEAYAKELDNNADSGTGFLGWVDSLTSRFSSVKEAGRAIGMTTEQIAKSIDTGTDYQATIAKLNKTIEDGTEVQNVYNGTGYTTVVTYSKSADAAKKVKNSLEENNKATLEKIKTDNQSRNVTDKMIDSWYKSGASLEWITAQTKSSAEKQVMAAEASRLLAQAHTDQANALRNADSAGTAYGQMLGSIGESIKQVQSLGVSNVWDKNAQSFNIFTEAGRTAQTALSNFAKTSTDYVDSMVSAGRSQKEVTDTMQSMQSEFIKTAEAMGIPKAQAEELAKQYGLVPEDVTTKFKAETEQSKIQLLQYLNLLSPIMDKDTYSILIKAVTSGAITDLDTLNSYANEATNPRNMLIGLSGVDDIMSRLQAMGLEAQVATDGKTLTITGDNTDALTKIAQIAGAHFDPKTQTVTLNKSQWDRVRAGVDQWQPSAKYLNVFANIIASGGGNNKTRLSIMDGDGKATGGLVTGPGTSTSDSIPTWLSNGEFVLKASTVKKLTTTYGSGFLNKMNTTGEIPARYGKELIGLIESSKNTAAMANMQGITVVVKQNDTAVLNAIDRTRLDVVGAIREQNNGSDSWFAEQAFTRAVAKAVNTQADW